MALPSTAARVGSSRKPPAESATARDLMYLVSRVAAGFEAILKTKEAALSLSQWAILEALAQDGGKSRPSQVARKLGFSRQFIRQASRKLMSLELVASDVPEGGKNAVELKLTVAGHHTLGDVGSAIDALTQSLYADRRGAAAVTSAVRTLKLLSIAMAAQTLEGNAAAVKRRTPIAATPGNQS